MTREYWKRYFMILRVVALIVLIAILVMGALQVYGFYKDKVGVTPSRTIQTYFDALGQGNYDEVYRLTAKENLTDIYGRPITQDEFGEQLQSLMGSQRQPFERIEMSKLYEKNSMHYYDVRLHSTVGGKAGASRLLLELRREEQGWVITYPFAIML